MKLFALAALLLTSSAAQAAVSAQALFQGLNAAAVRVQYTHEGRALVGGSIVEKSAGNLICQELTAGKAAPEYRCYERLVADTTAKGTYEAFETNELEVNFYSLDLDLLDASSTKQKFVKGGFCRTKSLSAPRPAYSFACYREVR